MDRRHEPDLGSSSFKASPYAYWTHLRDDAPVRAIRAIELNPLIIAAGVKLRF